MVVVTGETLGRGDDGLGRRLMTKFLGQLATLADRPHAIAFYNAGVKLLVRGCPALEALRLLDHEGVELVACGTCVEHFAIAQDLAIGRVTDMREIVATMQASEKVMIV
jgi:selenium metabolism protein YedF